MKRESTEQQSDLVTVYVRKGEDRDARTMSFPVPDMDQEILLNAGFAIDGNSATKTVRVNNVGSINDALWLEQVRLQRLMLAEGFDVEYI